tara:strand:+ start:86 stop:688 length:603 start_codon:yes stop_codon:yes gene_type:complete
MKPLFVSQRVVEDTKHGERRDALDQRWGCFLEVCGFYAVHVPNQPKWIEEIEKSIKPAGVLLTGGNDLHELGGAAPEREATEDALLDYAGRHKLRVFGVCRGFQFLLHRAGAKLVKGEGHSGTRHMIMGVDGYREVNSFHDWVVSNTPEGWRVRARGSDGTVESAEVENGRLAGQMWHPERETDNLQFDVRRFKNFFGVN